LKNFLFSAIISSLRKSPGGFRWK
jgi:hypothetical protein